MFRRDLRLFLHSLRTLILLIALLACGCIGLLFAVSGADDPTTVRLSLVLCNLDTESNYGSMLLGLASNHDLVQSVVELEMCDTEEQAEERVREGAVAAVVIPPGFFHQIAHGEGALCEVGPHVPLMNMTSLQVAAEFGATRAWLSPELTLGQIDDIARMSTIELGVTVIGSQELMITEHCLLMSQGPCNEQCETCPRRSTGHRLVDRKGFDFGHEDCTVQTCSD